MKKLAVINPRNVTEEEASTYALREAVRALVFDEDNKIALLKVSRDAYFKLPGGGVEVDEDFETALKRECLEEIGCEITNIKPLGCTYEYWKEDLEKQISYCYVTELHGQKGNPALTQSEMDRGFETVWITLDEAITILESCTPTQWEGDYIPLRELVFLREFVETKKQTREKINIVDELNNIIGVKYRDEINYEVDRYQCTGLWVTNSNGEVLIAQRKLTKEKDPGKWSCAVAGTVAEGETFESNIYKEAEEEIGLKGHVFKFGPLQKNELPRKNFAQWFMAEIDLPVEAFSLQEDEVEQITWIKPEKLIEDVKNNPEKYVSSFISVLPLLLPQKF